MANEQYDYLPAGDPKVVGTGVDKRVSNVAAVASADAVVAAGANPTKAEFDAVVALANETKAQLNALLAALKSQKVMQPDA